MKFLLIGLVFVSLASFAQVSDEESLKKKIIRFLDYEFESLNGLKIIAFKASFLDGLSRQKILEEDVVPTIKSVWSIYILPAENSILSKTTIASYVHIKDSFFKKTPENCHIARSSANKEEYEIACSYCGYELKFKDILNDYQKLKDADKEDTNAFIIN